MQLLTDAQLDEPLVGIGNPLSYLGEEKTLREMLYRLVSTKERWMDSVHGRLESKNTDKTVHGMLAHVVTFSAYRRTTVIEAFEYFGIDDSPTATRLNGNANRPPEGNGQCYFQTVFS